MNAVAFGTCGCFGRFTLKSLRHLSIAGLFRKNLVKLGIRGFSPRIGRPNHGALQQTGCSSAAVREASAAAAAAILERSEDLVESLQHTIRIRFSKKAESNAQNLLFERYLK